MCAVKKDGRRQVYTKKIRQKPYNYNFYHKKYKFNIVIQEKDFEAIYNRYYHELCEYLFLFTTDFNMIEDSIQSIFVKLWENRSNINISDTRAYLFISARNKIYNNIRNQNKHRAILSFILSESLLEKQASDPIDMNEFNEHIRQIIKTLPPQTRHIYLLSRKTALTNKQIADKENISIKTVEMHISKALKLISTTLKKFYK